MFIRQKSLEALTDEISHRTSVDLHPFDAQHFSDAMTSLVDSLNHWVSTIQEQGLQEKRLASDVAHELRTPLAALKTNAQVALKATDSEIRQKALQGIVDSVDRSTRLTQQWMLFSRLLTATPPSVSLSLYKVSMHIVADLAPLAVAKDIELAFFPEESPQGSEWEMMGNEKALHALMETLLDNAIRYTPQKGRVEVRLLQEINGVKASTGKSIGFCIQDTGPGIIDARREDLFIPFGKGTDNPHGGLGLAIASRAASLLNTHIEFLPYDPQLGLTVRVMFRR